MKKELAQAGLPVLRKIQKTAQNHPQMTKVDLKKPRQFGHRGRPL